RARRLVRGGTRRTIDLSGRSPDDGVKSSGGSDTFMSHYYDRREALTLAGGVLLGGALTAAPSGGEKPGRVVGAPQGARVGAEGLAAGGSAVDAAVAAALAAAVTDVQQCGIGGYGGHMVIAHAEGKKIVAIDFNTAAPKAARADLFPLDGEGKVKD